MKQKVSLFVLLLSALCLPQTVQAYDFSAVAPSGQNLFYTIGNNNSVSVVNPLSGSYYSYVSGALTIPDTVPHNGINYAVTSIGYEAFYGCNSLTSVTIPNSVTSIGSYAFSGCSGLTSVTIPNSVTYIGSHAFLNCSGLTSVTIPNSVTSIGYEAFWGCSGLTSVTIPNSVTYIGSSAFYGCSGLTSVTIPNSVTSIGYETFYGCSGLTSVTIPNSVTSIGSSAFYGCSGLTSVTIPNSVTSIGTSAFAHCSGLTSIIVEAGNTHYDSRDSCNAIIQTDLGLLIQGCQSTVIPEGITAIGNDAFRGCSGLTSVTIPNSVTSIGYSAFDGCNSLTSVTIPNSVTSIGSSAFYGCSGLTSVTIPNSVTSIGYETFYGCSGLTSVTIPNSVTSIGDEAFRDCSGLTSVTIPNSVTSIGSSAFSGCSSLTSVTIPNSVTSIGNYAFYGCYGLTSVYCLATAPPTLGYGSSLYSADIYVPCEAVTAYQGANEWSHHASRIHGTPTFDFVYSFASGNDTMGSVSVGVATCDSNITVTATAATGYQFAGWSDGGTGNPRTVHLTGDTVVTALFDYVTYVIAGQPNQAARGTVTGSDTVYYGDTVTLTATANYGYHFIRWNDGDTNNPRQVVATQNRTLTAQFGFNQYTISLSVDTIIHGSVSGGGTYNYLANRTLTATPNYGYHFTQWSDGNTDNPRVLSLTQDTALTAHFEINTYQLTVLANDTTLGTVAGSGNFTHGSTVTVTASATPGNRFDRWDDNTLLVNYTFTLTGNLQLIAIFVPSDTVFVHDTTYIDVHDTTHIDVHDTLVVTDTVTLTEYVPVHDTIHITIHDTTVVYQTDTLWLTDTVYIHDTVYITEEGIGDVVAINAKVYSSQGQVVVEGAEGHPVTLIDAVGRQLATKRDEYMPVRFDVPASGTYLVKIGDYATRRVVVIR